MITSSSSQDFESSQENNGPKKSFVIPKKNKTGIELLQIIDENEAFEYKLINNAIYDSCYDKSSKHLGHSLTRIQLINNQEIDEQYETNKKLRKIREQTIWKKELKKTKRAQITERILFFMCYDESKAIQIARNGFECSENENFLGDSLLGIHFGKNLDVMLKYEYTKKKPMKELYCIMAKAFYDPAKLKQISASMNNKAAGACMDHEGHVAFMNMDIALNFTNISGLFRNTKIFLYDLDLETCEFNKKPKNMMPYAILKYELKNINQISQHNPSIRYGIPNKNRYFNNVTQIESAPVNKKASTKTEFVQADFIPLFGVAKPNKIEEKPIQPVTLPEQPEKRVSQWTLYVERNKKLQQLQLLDEQQQQLNQSSNDNDLLYQSDACRLVKDFKPATPPPQPEKKQSIYSDDDESDDELELLEEYFRLHADRFNECSEKMPKWRIHYERTGNLDIVFRAGRQMECKVTNLSQLGLKYIDNEKNAINVNNSTNKLILTYESKRIKKNTVVSSSSDESIANSKIVYKPNYPDDISIDNKHVKIRINSKSFVNVDFSFIPTILNNKIVKNEQDEILKNEKTVPLVKQLTVNKSTQLIKNNQIVKTGTTQPTINNNSERNKLPIDNKYKLMNTTSTSNNPSTSIKPNSQPKEAVDKMRAKVNDILQKRRQDPTDTSAIKQSNHSEKKEIENIENSKKSSLIAKKANQTASLSSDNTALERRLLGIDKTKTIAVNKVQTPTSIKVEPVISSDKPVSTDAIATQNKTSNNVTIIPPRPSNIKEELKKVLEKYRKSTNPIPKPKQQEQQVDKSIQLIESIKSSAKRKKSFWDPDSDTEYDKLRNICDLAVKQQDDDEDDIDDDIVIVSKQNLKLPPVQYSKQFYDLNMNGLEAELRKFSPDYVSSCSSSPLNNSLLNNIFNNTVVTVTKSPIKLKNKSLQQQQQQSHRLSSNYRLSNIRQRYIHHIIVNNINNNINDQFNNQFDVDSLKNLKTNNQSKSQLDLNSNNKIEIHAGGFRCIEEHNFHQSANYLRRTKSFEPKKFSNQESFSKTLSFINVNEINNDQTASNKKISLNDYVNNRSKTAITPVNQSQISINSNSSIETTFIKKEALSPSIQAHSHSILNNSAKKLQLPSLSLIDELKKRINSIRDEKKEEIYPNERLIKEDDLYDDDELKKLQSQHSKLKRRHKKKHEKSKKKIKLQSKSRSSSNLSSTGTVLSTSQLLLSSSQSNLSPSSTSSSLTLRDFDEKYNSSLSSDSTTSFSSELLLSDDNCLSLSDSSFLSLSSLSSSVSSTMSSNNDNKSPKKSKHKKKLAKKRKISISDDNDMTDVTLNKEKSQANKRAKSEHQRKKKSKHRKSGTKKDRQKSSKSLSNGETNTDEIVQTNSGSSFTASNSYSTRKLIMTNDEDYSIEIGDINLDVFDKEVSKNLTSEKSIESKNIETESSINNDDSQIKQEPDSNKLTNRQGTKLTAGDSYDNFYSDYDIDNMAFFSTSLPAHSADLPQLTVTMSDIEVKIEPSIPIDKIMNEPEKLVKHSPLIEKVQEVLKKPALNLQSTPVTSQPTKQLTPKPSPANSSIITNPSAAIQSPKNTNVITTPKTTILTQNMTSSGGNSRFQQTTQNNNYNNYYNQSYVSPVNNKQRTQTTMRMNDSSTLPPNPSYTNKMNKTNRPDYVNNLMHANMTASVDFNNIHGLDHSPSLMPNLNYIQNFDSMNLMGSQMPQNAYNATNMNNYSEFDYQYSNSNYRHPKNNNNYQFSNNNFSWQGNNNTNNLKDKYNNYNNIFQNSQRNHQRSYSNNNNNNNNNSRNINTTSNNNLNNNRQQANNNNQRRSNNNNKRTQNPDQEDGEIVD